MKYLKPEMTIVLFDENVALTLEAISTPVDEDGIIEEGSGTQQNSLPY